MLIVASMFSVCGEVAAANWSDEGPATQQLADRWIHLSREVPSSSGALIGDERRLSVDRLLRLSILLAAAGTHVCRS